MAMDIIISHNSALEYWRMHRGVRIDDAARLRRKNLPGRLPRASDIRGAAPSGMTYPINLMVSSQNAKRRTKMVRPRVCSGRVPEWCFIKVGEGVSVSSPQFCFFQMAGELSFVELIKLGLELCGTYSLSAPGMPGVGSGGETSSEANNEFSDHYINEYGNIRYKRKDSKSGEASGGEHLYNNPPLTSVRALKAFASRMEGVRGRKKALRALRYIADGSASPMETIVLMLLVLPYKLGGYGFAKPELNKRVDIRNVAGQVPDRTYYKCDFYWPKANLAAEYDSDLHHTGPERIESDSIRRLHLKANGIEVVTVTRGQLRSIPEFEGVAKTIAKGLGKRLSYKNPGFQEAQKELRKLLL